MKKLITGIVLFAVIIMAGCGGGGGGSSIVSDPANPVFSDADRTLIHDAVHSGDINQVRSILNNKPELINAMDEQGDFPIHSAFESPLPEFMASVLISEYDADPNTKSNWDGDYPIHRAARVNTSNGIRVLVAKGAKLDLLNASGETAVWVTISECAEEALKELLDAGADGSIRYRNQTPLQGAMARYNYGTAQILTDHGYME